MDIITPDPYIEIINSVSKEDTRKQFLLEVLTNDLIEFKDLYTEKLKISETTARHHLKVLMKYDLIIRVKKKGTKAIFLSINPHLRNRLRNFFNIKLPFSYIGGLGTEDPVSQLKSFLTKLSISNYNFKLVDLYVTDNEVSKVTSLMSSSDITNKINISEVHKSDFYNIDLNLTDMDALIRKRINEYEPIIDITGGPKIPSIALYILSQKYGLKKVYIPRNEGENIVILP